MNRPLPETVAADKLDLILNKLTAIEQRLEVLEQVNDVPGLIATAVDTTDAYFKNNSPDLQRLIPSLENLLHQLMQPEIIEGIGEMVHTLPMLAKYSKTVESLPGLLATAGDSFDEMAQNLEEQKIVPLEILAEVLPMLQTLLQPETLNALHQFVSALPEITPLILSAKDAPGMVATAVDTVDDLYQRLMVSNEMLSQHLERIQDIQSQISAETVLDTTSNLIKTLQEGKKQAPLLGPLGLFKSLRDPDLQRFLGYLVYVTRHMSQEILKK